MGLARITVHGPRRRVHTHTSAIRASHPKPPSPPGHVCRPRSHLKLVADWTLSDADSRDRPTALRLKCLSQQAHLASTQIAATPLITNAVRILAFASCATTPRLGPHGQSGRFSLLSRPPAFESPLRFDRILLSPFPTAASVPPASFARSSSVVDSNNGNGQRRMSGASINQVHGAFLR